MDLPELQIIRKISAYMNEYQKINKIKGMCVANNLVLHTIIKKYFPNIIERVKVVPVICYYFQTINDTHTPTFHIHLVLKIDENKIIDPSYDVDSIPDVLYLDNIKTFQLHITDLEQTNHKGTNFKYPIDDKKRIIRTYISFINYADLINKRTMNLTDKIYYLNILEWVLPRLELETC
jgi:hypothetical protein